MTADHNLGIARAYVAGLSGGAGHAELDHFFAPEFIQEEFPNRLMPEGATRDLNAMRVARQRGLALMRDQRFEIVSAIASGDTVAMELIWTGTVGVAAGPFAAGQQLRARFAVFMDFTDGRIVRQRNYDCFDPF